jgi:hypothetical protein
MFLSRNLDSQCWQKFFHYCSLRNRIWESKSLDYSVVVYNDNRVYRSTQLLWQVQMHDLQMSFVARSFWPEVSLRRASVMACPVPVRWRLAGERFRICASSVMSSRAPTMSHPSKWRRCRQVEANASCRWLASEPEATLPMTHFRTTVCRQTIVYLTRRLEQSGRTAGAWSFYDVLVYVWLMYY